MGWHVHQSDIKSWLNCGEQVRLTQLVRDNGRFETDAATVGTVQHAVIEAELVDGFFETEHDCQAWAAQHFLQVLEVYAEAGSVYSRSSFETDIKALRAVERLASVWYRCDERTFLLGLPEGAIIPEWDFSVPLGVSFRNEDVYLGGQADLLYEIAGPDGPLAAYGLVSDPELAATQAAIEAETPMGPLE